MLQLSIKNEQKLDCGGAYIKLTGDVDQDSFGGDTPYQVSRNPFFWFGGVAWGVGFKLWSNKLLIRWRSFGRMETYFDLIILVLV